MRTRCAAGCTGSTRPASTGSVTGPGPGASGGSPRRSGRGSLPWPGRCRPGVWTATGPGSCPRMMSAGRPSGLWTPWLRRPGTPASGSGAARCGGSCWPRRCAGGGPAAGRRAPTRNLSPKDPHRGALYRPAAGPHGDGPRIKAPLEYSRGPEKTWVYGGLRVADGQEVPMCAASRNSAFYQDFLQLEEQANPEGVIYVITDNLSSHDSKSTRAWLEDHPPIRNAFIPKGACWVNFQGGWWRIFRKTALAGQTFADPDEIAHATRVATAQLNARARPWIWGRPQPKPRSYRRRFIYSL